MSNFTKFQIPALALILTTGLFGQRADLSGLVVTGDSLAAGYQNSQLIETSQIHGFAQLIANQAGTNLNPPLIPAPGFPQITILNGQAVATGFLPIQRRNNNQTRNVAVPGFSIGAFVVAKPTCPANPASPTYPIDVMAQLILHPTCSPSNLGPTQLELAASLHPTTAILNVGSNDALFSILFGGAPTPSSTFAALHGQAASTLNSASGNLVIANVPDVTLLPYLTSVPKLAQIIDQPLLRVMLGLRLGLLDKVTPYAFPIIEGMLASGNITPLPESVPQGPVVIRAAQLLEIQRTVLAYNVAIANEARSLGATVVDLYGLLNDLALRGVVVRGNRLTTDFMGGIFSLDGVHPTNTGYALIANEYIKTMNRSMRTGIPPVSVSQVAETDPLIFDEGNPGRAKGHVAAAIARLLAALLRER